MTINKKAINLKYKQINYLMIKLSKINYQRLMNQKDKIIYSNNYYNQENGPQMENIMFSMKIT